MSGHPSPQSVLSGLTRCEPAVKPGQLNWNALLQAKTRLREISEDVLVRLSAALHASGHSSELSGPGLRLTVRAVSNLLHCLATKLAFSDGADQDFYRTITEVSLQVLNQALQTALQFQSIGEAPLCLGGDFVSVNASLYSLTSPPPTVSINGMSFRLPRGLSSTVLAPVDTQAKENSQANGRQIALPGSTDSNNSREGSKPDSSEQPWRPEKTLRGDYRGYHTVFSCYQTRTILFSRNPFSFMARDGDLVQSEVASLDVYNCAGTTRLSVHDLPSDDNIDIVLPRAGHRGTGSQSPAVHSKHYLGKTAMNLHHLNSSVPHRPWDSSSTRSSTHRMPRGSSSGEPDISDSYLHVHIQFDPVLAGRRSFPVLVILSHYNPPHNLKDHVLKKLYKRDVNEVKILLPSHSLEGGRQYHIGVVEASFNSGRRRPTEVKGRNYTLNTWWSNCLYWNTSLEGWHSNGCSVMPSSTVDQLHCKCNHLTTFGSHFELIPTYLSYTDVDEFFNSLHENPLVVVVVALVLLAYIVGVLLLGSADAQDTRKDSSSCVYLQDNAPSHNQKYEISLETGYNRQAGTTSKISIILHGEEGMSETRELTSDDSRPMFECNSRDRFILTLPESLGRIQKIQLWHNNSGSSPGWYLRQAVVRDLNSGQAAYFLCQQWLAVDRDDGKVEREFTAVEGRNISFSMVFWLKGSQYLSDFHTWMSVLTRPPHSRFTRVQRLTVCLTLLSAYMCLSALWFKQLPQEVHREFGLLDLSWQNIIVGCVCCLVIVPVNLLLGFLFRRSRVHFPGSDRDRALLSELAKSGDHSEGEDEPAHSQVTYSILDQSILNWQSIQDWAQKQWLKRQHSVRSSANSVKTSQTSPQLSAPSTTPLVQTLLAEYDTDHASSAWDASSRVVTEKVRTKTTSDESSNGYVSDILSSTRRVFLPFWCRYLAWTLCAVIICISTTVTIMYGFRFGHTKGVMWIQSVYFSFIVCIFIVQPMLILVRVLHVALRHRKNLAVFNHYEDGVYGHKEISGVFHKQISFSSEEDEELQKGVAARSRSRYLRFAGPPQEKQLKSSRKRQIKQKRALALLRHSLCFFVMVIVLGTIAFGKDTRSPYLFNKAVKQALAEKRYDGLSFLNLKSPKDWFHWSKAAIIDTLYSQALFSGEEQNNTVHNFHQAKPFSWLILSQIQLRQLALLPAECKPVPYFRDAVDNLKCHQSHGIGSEAKEDSPLETMSWKDTNENLFIGSGFWGRSSWYDDSGYVIKLDKSMKTAAHQLEKLEERSWISSDTQAVIVEMALYNAPTNLFSSVTLLMEIDLPLGKIYTSDYVMSTRLFRYITFFDSVILACELLFVVVTLWMIFQEMQVLTDLVAIVLFCVLVKSLRILRYHQLFWRLQTVYRRCRREILFAAILYICLLVAFGCLGTGLFGSSIYSLRSVWSSMLAVSALSIRVFNWAHEWDSSETQTQVFPVIVVFGYAFIHGFVLTYMFAVLSQRLKKTRKCRVMALTGHQLVAFYWDIFLKMIGIREEPSVVQPDNTLPAEFTMAEILYLVEELLFRMNAVLGTSGLPDKHRSFSDSDATPNGVEDAMSSGESMDNAVMINDDRPLLTQSEDPLPRLEQRLQKIEDKLCSQEPYLAQLLKLDSIGADVLSEEKENELRSHLEFEIFRQLQMQRRVSTADDDPSAQWNACYMDDPLSSLNVPGLEHIEEAVTNLLSRQSSVSKTKQNTHPTSSLKLTSSEQNSLLERGQVNQGATTFSSDVFPSTPKHTLSWKTSGKQVKPHQPGDPGHLGQRHDFLTPEQSSKIRAETTTSGYSQQLEQQSKRKDCFSATTVGPAPSMDKRFRVDVLYRPDGNPSSSSRSGGNSSGRESDTPIKPHVKTRHGLIAAGTCSKLSTGTASPQSSESDRGQTFFRTFKS
ncbi:LOW QUALITY PROTEIN: polycystic kidney disease protein 1-like 1 [Elysia marginata]|uniref:Polycystic kidney disease protein 1-like 1 n=1 Tax=Elysia marginata TaxID=1093978 RepID=A0AAV4FIF6_9GAST|nr:LOW QUALITY PROTEIN: polycystic kidney disease protein 1-like 1 [Elysia marginata]